jgi:hypothetical protein
VSALLHSSTLLYVGAVAVVELYPAPSVVSNVISNVECTGNEAELSQCGSTQQSCRPLLTRAGVVCHALSTEEGNCSDGDIRLVNGTIVTPLEGRVEICINNAWGTVCDRRFSEDDAEIICRQTGFRFNGMCQC